MRSRCFPAIQSSPVAQTQRVNAARLTQAAIRKGGARVLAMWCGQKAFLIAARLCHAFGKGSADAARESEGIGKLKVGFIGLGNVGGKLSGSLLRNGVDLTVCDLNPARVDDFVARGAQGAATPLDVMRTCDAVITCLPSPAASAAVMAEMLPAVAPGKIWMEMSTTDAVEVSRLGAQVRGTGWRGGGLPGFGGLPSG